MVATVKLGLELISASQSQKEVTYALAMNRLDVIVQGRVLSANFSNPPTTPAEGDAYIIGASPTGVWASKANQIAYYYGGGWYYMPPVSGMRLRVLDVGAYYYYNGSAWVFDGGLLVQTAKTANYPILLTDAYSVLQANAASSALLFRLPPADLARNGFPVSVKLTNNTNTLTVYGAQNRLLHSEDISNAAWTKSNTTAGSALITGPLFGRLADKIQENTANSTHEVTQNYSKGSGVTKLTASVYFKSAERTEAYLIVDDGTATNRVTVKANLSSGALNVQTGAGTYTHDSSTIENVGNGWYRITAFCTVPTGAGTVTTRLRLYDGASATYTGVLNNGVYCFGAMLVEAPVSGTYTKTTSVAVNETIEGAATDTISTSYGGADYICDGLGNWLKV